MMFNYPDSANRSYLMDNPPVVRVVVQVAYPPAARLAVPEALAELQEALGETFQLHARSPVGLQISFGGAPPVMPATTPVFLHRDGYELAITPEVATLAIDHRYRDRSAFASVLEPALATLQAVGRIKDYVRIGVRYINAAPANVADFRTWFKPEFVGWAASDVVATDTQQTWVLITQLAHTDPQSPVTNGVIRYGYLQSGVGPDITNSPAGTSPSFIADIDLGSQKGGAYDARVIAETFRAINHEIAAFFANSMTSAGIEHFALHARES